MPPRYMSNQMNLHGGFSSSGLATPMGPPTPPVLGSLHHHHHHPQFQQTQGIPHPPGPVPSAAPPGPSQQQQPNHPPQHLQQGFVGSLNAFSNQIPGRIPPGIGSSAGLQQANSSNMYIRDVWATNLQQEMAVIRELVDRFPVVSLGIEFPGIVGRPIGQFRSISDYHYQTLRCNTDLLKIIQLAITLSDIYGNYPEMYPSTWQFNFKFSLANDMYQAEAVDLLQKSGVDFKRHEDFGIDPFEFGELITTSGLVLNPDIKWISFHSGYDFGYLFSLLTNTLLPAEEQDFLQLLHIFLPTLYDLRLMTSSTKRHFKGDLLELAEELRVIRAGPSHHAASDSLLTSKCFFELRRLFYMELSNDSNYRGYLYGLGPSAPKTSDKQASTDSININANNSTNNNNSNSSFGGMLPTSARLTNGMRTASGTSTGNNNGSYQPSPQVLFQYGKMGGGA